MDFSNLYSWIFLNVEFHHQIEFSVMKHLYCTLLPCSIFFVFQLPFSKLGSEFNRKDQ